MNEPLINLDTVTFYLYAIFAAFFICLVLTEITLNTNKSIAELLKVVALPFVTCLVLAFVIYAPEGTIKIKSIRNDMEVFNKNNTEMVKSFGVFGLFLPHKILDNCKTDECEYRTTKYKHMEAIWKTN